MVNTKQQTFGNFLKKKRLEKEFTIRGFAGMLGVSPVYLSEVEKDRKPAPSNERMNQIARLLVLDKREIEEMYDLAAMSRSRPVVSGDLPEYIMENEVVRVALRTAKEADASDEEWLAFIEKLNKRKVPGDNKEKDGNG